MNSEDDKLETLVIYSKGELELNNGVEIESNFISANSLSALNRLARYKPIIKIKDYPSFTQASVMIALFTSRDGKSLNVLFSTRASNMRSHPNQVSLPGGKVEKDDLNLIFTARREAFEEVGIPLDSVAVQYLCTLDPTISPNGLLVTPIVFFVIDNSLKLSLNSDEVADVFSHSLEDFLIDSSNHSHFDYQWLKRPEHRFHKFISKGNRNITGFTAQILINTAKIAYGRETEFISMKPGQLTQQELINLVLKEQQQLKPKL